MARCPFASWHPISGSAGAYSGGPFKVVHHKTQGASIASARAAYANNASDPHFTVGPSEIQQHIDTAVAARSLRNESGGVQTNRDSAVQIEVVGFSGTTCPQGTLDNLARLLVWIGDIHKVPWFWPEGRPPLSAATGYGRNTGERHGSTWDATSGHYGHSQVPENDHWDPAYTDAEWAFLNSHMAAHRAASAPPAPKERIFVDSNSRTCTDPVTKGVWIADPKGAVYAIQGAPYLGGYNAHPEWGAGSDPRVCIGIEPAGNGYKLIFNDLAVYNFAR